MSSSRGRAAGQSEYAAEYQRETGYPADTRQAQYETERAGGAGAFAGSVLAGMLMIIGGAIGFLNGLGMVIRGGFYTYHAGYAYHWNTAGWGWVSLILGGLVFVAGVCVILGMVWARVLGVVLASLSAIGHFLMLPYYPIWGIILVAFDLFIIWALVARRRPV
jgi:hypothetical protein